MVCVGFASHQVEPTAPSGPIQNTSRCPDARATAAMPMPPLPAAPGGVIGKGWWSPQDAPGAESHQVEPTAPSGPIQNTSRWSGVRATTATAEPARAAPGGAIPNGAWSPHDAPGAESHHVDPI